MFRSLFELLDTWLRHNNNVIKTGPAGSTGWTGNRTYFWSGRLIKLFCKNPVWKPGEKPWKPAKPAVGAVWEIKPFRSQNEPPCTSFCSACNPPVRQILETYTVEGTQEIYCRNVVQLKCLFCMTALWDLFSTMATALLIEAWRHPTYILGF